MKLSHRQQIFTRNIAKLIQRAETLEIGLTFGDAWRSRSQMLLNYYGYDVVKTRDKPILVKRKPTSKTLNSRHGVRLAVDFNFFINGELTYNKHKLQCLGDYWESLHPNNRWGGNWTSFIDTPHFEMK